MNYTNLFLDYLSMRYTIENHTLIYVINKYIFLKDEYITSVLEKNLTNKPSQYLIEEYDYYINIPQQFLQLFSINQQLQLFAIVETLDSNFSDGHAIKYTSSKNIKVQNRLYLNFDGFHALNNDEFSLLRMFFNNR